MATCAPVKKENGGPGSIAEQSVDHHVNVLLGGGRAAIPADDHRRSARRQDRDPVGAAAGLHVVFDAANLDGGRAARACSACSTPATCRSSGAALQATPFPGSGLPAGQTCAENQRPANEPSLADMTTKAIDLLHEDDGPGRGSTMIIAQTLAGFFLQVEGASIDKQDHVEAPCQQIGETIAFDRAIRVGLDFAQTPPRHADHRHRRPRAHQSDRARAVGVEPLDAAGHAEHAADEGRPVADDRQLRRRGRTDSRRITPAPKFGSPRRARRRRTSSASPIRPICSTRWRERWDSNSWHQRVLHSRAENIRPALTVLLACVLQGARQGSTVTSLSSVELARRRMMPLRHKGAGMNRHQSDKIDEVATGLDELKTAVDELKDDPPASAQPATIDTLDHAIDLAIDATDQLEEQKE